MPRPVGQPRKRRKHQNDDPLIPITFACIFKAKASRKHRKTTPIKVLIDSGASSSIINKSKILDNKCFQGKATEWDTTAGRVATTGRCELEFGLHEFSTTRRIKHNFHVINAVIPGYDMIIGRDLMQHLKLDVMFSTSNLVWFENGEIPLKPANATAQTHFYINDPQDIMTEADKMSSILDAKYEKANLDKVAKETLHISNSEKSKLKNLLGDEELFDGTIGTWNMDRHKVNLKDDVKPYHGRPYQVPKAHERALRNEVDRLVKIGVLKKVNHSQWGAPCFAIPKKDGTIRFISDFRELNKRVKRTPFPLPKIQDMLLKMEGFQYATSLDLNMGYYHIKLDASSRKLCTIVLPWGKYEYNALPMGLCSSCDIFQEKMSELMQGLEFVRTYIDDLLCITNSTFDDHLVHLEKVLKRLQKAGLKINPGKSFFAQPELEYLGYWITREGIMPTPQKVQAIQNIAVPTKKKQLRSFIGMINYYRDMWIRRSDILAPLAKLTSKEAKWKWTEEHQNAFDTIKRIVSQETLLRHPDFNKPFEIHTDASKAQLGAVISQEGHPIAFYSRKLSPAQLNYTTTERELLAIVETLKEFRNILLGQEIKVWTDHQNLTYKTFNTERVMRWRMIAEQYGAELHYIPGSKNIVADALSRLGLEPSTKSEPNETVKESPQMRLLAQSFAFTPVEVQPPSPTFQKQGRLAQIFATT